MVTVELTSDPFGAEQFHYDSLDEAIEAVRRLVEASWHEFQDDGIERRVSIVVGD